jgi:hypothetical protein
MLALSARPLALDAPQPAPRHGKNFNIGYGHIAWPARFTVLGLPMFVRRAGLAGRMVNDC